MSFGSKILKYKDDILKDLNEILKIPSCAVNKGGENPFGEEAARALNWILNRAKEMGLDVLNVDNYAGHAEYGEGKELAGILTHVDVVPAGDGWSVEPFKLTEKDGKIFGRGVADDKGSAIIALYCLKVLRDENVKTKRRIRAIFGSGEEIGMDDMNKYFSEQPIPDLAFTPDSEYGICNREKGILQIEVTSKDVPDAFVKEFISGNVINAVPDLAYAKLNCDETQYEKIKCLIEKEDGIYNLETTNEGVKISVTGLASHAAWPEKGNNAAVKLIRFLKQNFNQIEFNNLFEFINSMIGIEIYGESLEIATEDQYSGKLTLNVGKVRVNNNENSVQIDIRYPVTKNGKEILEKICQKAKNYNLNVELLNHDKPLFVEENSEIVTILKKSYKEILSKECNVYYTGGGTYARCLNDKGVAFGPVFEGEEARLHNCDENLDLDKFMLHAQICLEAAYNLCKD